jgi:hypothetical protein
MNGVFWWKFEVGKFELDSTAHVHNQRSVCLNPVLQF